MEAHIEQGILVSSKMWGPEVSKIVLLHGLVSLALYFLLGQSVRSSSRRQKGEKRVKSGYFFSWAPPTGSPWDCCVSHERTQLYNALSSQPSLSYVSVTASSSGGW